MGLKVDGIPYDSWDDVPRELREAIAASGEGDRAPTAATGAAEVPEEEDELDRLVRLAEAREAGLPVEEPPPPSATESTCPTFELDGRVYTSLDDVPPEIRGALRLQLLGPPAPTVEPRLPAALRGLTPPTVGAPTSTGGTAAPPAGPGGNPPGDSLTGAGARSGELGALPVDPAAAPMLPTRSKVAIAVMLLVVVALFLATRLIG